MVAMTMFSNVATTGRSHPLRFNLYRHGVGAMISNHFGSNSHATSLRRKEGVHIAFGFFAGYPGPMAFDCGLEKVEISVSHTYIPYNTSMGGSGEAESRGVVALSGNSPSVSTSPRNR